MLGYANLYSGLETQGTMVVIGLPSYGDEGGLSSTLMQSLIHGQKLMVQMDSKGSYGSLQSGTHLVNLVYTYSLGNYQLW